MRIKINLTSAALAEAAAVIAAGPDHEALTAAEAAAEFTAAGGYEVDSPTATITYGNGAAIVQVKPGVQVGYPYHTISTIQITQ